MNEFYDIRKEYFELSFRMIEDLKNNYAIFHFIE